MIAKKVISALALGKNQYQEDAVSNWMDKGVFTLADGFGSGGVGRHAAQLAVESMSSFLVRNSGDLDATLPFVLRRYFSLCGNMAFNALIHANRELLSRNKKAPLAEAGGASAIAALLDDDFLAVASVGVCSARLFRGEAAPQLLNRPRTYQQLRNPSVDAGLDPSGVARVDIPMMALGVHEHFEPEVFEVHVQKGDWILLHSDGLTPRLLKELQVIYRSATSSAGFDAEKSITRLLREAQNSGEISDHLALSCIQMG